MHSNPFIFFRGFFCTFAVRLSGKKNEGMESKCAVSVIQFFCGPSCVWRTEITHNGWKQSGEHNINLDLRPPIVEGCWAKNTMAFQKTYFETYRSQNRKPTILHRWMVFNISFLFFLILYIFLFVLFLYTLNTSVIGSVILGCKFPRDRSIIKVPLPLPSNEMTSGSFCADCVVPTHAFPTTWRRQGNASHLSLIFKFSI